MNKLINFFRLVIELSFLTVLAIGLILVIRNVSLGNLGTTDEILEGTPPYPPPVRTDIVPIEAIEQIEQPIPTIPPVPTLLPTPFVTPVPSVQPPIIPDVVGKIEQPFWIYYWQDNEIWRVDDQGIEKQFLLDTYSKMGQWLTGNPIPNSDCCWDGQRLVVSPDGKKLALVVVDKIKLAYKGESFKNSILVYDTQIDEANLLSEGVQPVWSPDGQRIAFLYQGNLWVTELNSNQLIKIAGGDPAKPDQVVSQMTWSPDGNSLAYLVTQSMGTYPELRVIDLQNPEQFSTLVPESAYSLRDVRWSVDGNALLYISSEGEGSGPDGVDNLWTISIKDGNRKQLTRDLTINNFDLSMDGKWVILAATLHYERELFFYDIWLINLLDDELFRLTFAPPEDNFSYWSPDETRIIIRREGVGLVTLSLEGGKIVELGVDPGFNFAVGGLR